MSNIPPSSDRADRAAIAQRLEDFVNRRATKVEHVSDEELDTVIEEALEHVRHGRGLCRASARARAVRSP